MLIDGKIKLKNGTQIERFTEKGLKFEDGSEVEADVVVFATGCVRSAALHALFLLIVRCNAASLTPATPSVTSSAKRRARRFRLFGA